MTMRTLTILVLTLFTLILSKNTTLDAAYNGQNSFISTTISNTEIQTVQKTPTPRTTNETITMPATGEKKTNATPTASSTSTTPTPTVTSESRSSASITQLTEMSSSSPNKTIASANTKSVSKFFIFTIVLVILLVLVLAGCIFGLWRRQSTQDDSTPRLLQSMRDTLRAGINNLGNRVGIVLWPENKREGEEEEEEVEGKQGDVEDGGQERDSGNNSERKDGRGEQSDSSDDYSSLEGKDLREMALSRQEANKQSGDEEEVEGSMPSDGRHSPAQGQANGKKEGGLEEIALINSPTEEDENAELCDETIF